MTTLPAKHNPAAQHLTKAPLAPRQLTAEINVPGFMQPRWVAYPVPAGARASIVDALHWHEGRMVSAEPKAIIASLWRLANHFKKDRTPREWEELFHDFVDDLREFGLAHVIEALTEHRRASKWFPKPVEIREICERKMARDREMVHRARVLLELEPPRFFEVPTPAESEGNVVVIDSGRLDQMFRDMQNAPKLNVPPRDLSAERADRLALVEARERARAAVAKHPKLVEARAAMKRKREKAK